MGDVLDAVTKTMCVIICWVDTPIAFGSMMGNEFYSEIEKGRRNVKIN